MTLVFHAAFNLEKSQTVEKYLIGVEILETITISGDFFLSINQKIRMCTIRI